LIAGQLTLDQACEIIEKGVSQRRRITSGGTEQEAKIFPLAWGRVRRERPELFIVFGKARPTGFFTRVMRMFRSLSEEEEAELREEPITGELRDLIWLGDDSLAVIMKQLQAGTSPETIAIPDANGIVTHLLQSKMETIEWVRGINRVAAKAVGAGDRRNAADAIKFFRESLKLAPGCDLFLMSLGVCYAASGQRKKGIAYLRRAAEISPHNARIKKNLEDVKLLVRK
jgi:tetratricopeptide (TPR) repeat protein